MESVRAMHFPNKTEQLARQLRKTFSLSEWTLGAKLPSEDALMDRFGVSRPSMREALNTLAAEGILVRKHGSGTYLVRRPGARVEVYLRMENIANVSGYWYRDILQNIQALAAERAIRVIPVVGFGERVDDVLASMEHHLSRPVDSDLAGMVSLLMVEEIDDLIRQRRRAPFSSLCVRPGCGPGAMTMDYLALAELFRDTMRERGYRNFSVVYNDDPQEKMGRANHSFFREVRDRITGGDRTRHVAIQSDFICESDFRRNAERRFLAWCRSPGRPRAAVFMDDGLAGYCFSLMLRNGIRVPEDLAVLTHANVGREFDCLVNPCRAGFDSGLAARALWGLLFGEGGATVLKPALTPGDSLPVLPRSFRPDTRARDARMAQGVLKAGF